MITIHVTEEDIRHGQGANCNAVNCPIALAIRRTLCPLGYEMFFPIRVDVGTAKIKGVYYNLPASALKFINDFDFHNEVKPFSFELPYDEECTHHA